jgi:hypothetical protein
MSSESGGHDVAPAIWAAVIVIIAGTIIGGIALIEWMWPLFWIGIGMFVVGSIAAYVLGIMDTVSEFGPAPEHH